MSIAKETLELKLIANAKGFNKSIGGVKSNMTGLQKQSASIGKGMSSAFKGAAVGIGVATVAIGAAIAIGKNFVGAANKQAEAEARVAAVIKSTGGAAGLTAAEVEKLAAKYQGLTTVGDESILMGQSMLLTFTNIGKDVFPQTTETMLNMATALAGGLTPSAEQLKTTSIQLGKALNDPVKGISALSRVGVKFTEEQVKSIKTFQEQGDIASAQKVILDELAVEFGGLAEAMASTPKGRMQQIANELGDMKEKVGDVINKGLLALLPHVQSLIKLLKDNLGPVLEIVSKIFSEQLMPVINELGTLLGGLFNKVIATTSRLFKSFTKNILPRLIQLFNGVIEIVKPLIEQYIENYKILIEKLTPAYEKVIEIVGKLMNLWIKTVLPIYKQYGKMLGWVMGLVIDFAVVLVDILMVALESVLWVINAVTSGLEALNIISTEAEDKAEALAKSQSKAKKGFDITKQGAVESAGAIAGLGEGFNMLSGVVKETTKEKKKANTESVISTKSMNAETAALRALAEEEAKRLKALIETAEAAKYLKQESSLPYKSVSEVPTRPIEDNSDEKDDEIMLSKMQKAEDLKDKLSSMWSNYWEDTKYVAESAAMSVGNSIGAMFNADDTAEGMKNMLKTLGNMLIDMAQAFILTAQAVALAKGVTTFGTSLIVDSILIGGALTGLEVLRGYINSLAVGASNIPNDQLAQLHKGEMVVPKSFNEAIQAGDITIGSGGRNNRNNGNQFIDVHVNKFKNAIGYYDNETSRVLI